MLPSKGYFKSLNCPYFQNGFCNRPHCHFRHTRKDKTLDDNQQLEDADQSSQITDILSDVVEETSSDSSWPAPQQLPSTSVSYKPTPIVELKKRHVPVTTAPSVTFSSSSQKRRIEYDVKSIKKPKVKYIPEAVNTDSNSNGSYTTNVNNTVYRATKISDHSDQLLNGENANQNALQQDTEESEGEIDFDQVSNELNFLDEILKEYEKPVSIKNLIESNLSEIRAQNEKEKEQIKSKTLQLSGDVLSNGFSKPLTPLEANDKRSSEAEPKQFENCDHKDESSHSSSKNRAESSSSNTTEKSKKKTSTSSSASGVKDVSKSSSEHRRKSIDHHKNEKDTTKSKGRNETSSGSSKSAKREIGSESSFDKLLKSGSNKSSNSIKQSKKEHGSSSHKSSSKESEHKSSSSKSMKKDSERESNSNKSSRKESDRKNSSSKSHKKESDHQSKSSKSSKSEPHESSRKRTHSPENDSNNKRHKDNSETVCKQGDSRKSSKYKDESRHRKESNEKRSTKENKSSNSKEKKKRERHDGSQRDKNRQAHSVSESDKSDAESDDVEIISEAVPSIIVLDSEDSCSENSMSEHKSVHNVESSPSQVYSSRGASPAFPSDVSDVSDSDVDDTAKEDTGHWILVSNGKKKSQDDASLLDHRVQSRMKNRVSLGSTWKPPTKKKIEIMTPGQRLLLFAKLREKEEKDNDSQSNAGRVKIGCVPNVRHLLEEKERLLKGSNKIPHPTNRTNRATVGKSQVTSPQSQVEDQDVIPTAPLGCRHPLNRGADLYTRRAMLEKLYKCEKQLLQPHKLFRDAKDKCLQEEFKIWEGTNHNTYEKEINSLILRKKSEIPAFTLRFFTSIRAKQSVLFPKELRKKPENGKGQSSPTSEESLYTSLLKYCLTDEQLEKEGYPRKKVDPSTDRMLACINQESLDRWKKVQGKPPHGEFVCSNCSKFYSVDENGMSCSRWECRYHAKKACRTTRDKSGLLERKARCCGNAMDNPCMSSEYHSTETRDLQNLEGFVETKEPKGEMPTEGWGIFALDCEMYWSTRGLELGRVTVVNVDERCVYDTFVKPEFPVTDYSTRMSGITKENLESASRTFTQVQSDLMRLFNAKTILIGHSLENDLKALQIIHHKVVDTAIVFKHGEYKQALKVLASERLKEVIQNEEDGHDSAEDAVTCIKLMMQKVIKDANIQARRAPPAPRGRYRTSHMGL